MLGQTHRLAGIAAGIALAGELNIIPIERPFAFAGVIFVSAMGSLMPDADQPNSTIGRRFFLLWLPLYILRMIIRIIAFFAPSMKQVSRGLAHRGISHSPWFWGVFGALFWCVPWMRNEGVIYFYAFFAGIATHLLLDYLTGGIPLIPFSLKRNHPPIVFKTKGYFEFLAASVLGIWIGIMVLSYLGLRPAIRRILVMLIRYV